jgi:hypothetical protein
MHGQNRKLGLCGRKGKFPNWRRCVYIFLPSFPLFVFAASCIVADALSDTTALQIITESGISSVLVVADGIRQFGGSAHLWDGSPAETTTIELKSSQVYVKGCQPHSSVFVVSCISQPSPPHVNLEYICFAARFARKNRTCRTANPSVDRPIKPEPAGWQIPSLLEAVSRQGVAPCLPDHLHPHNLVWQE